MRDPVYLNPYPQDNEYQSMYIEACQYEGYTDDMYETWCQTCLDMFSNSYLIDAPIMNNGLEAFYIYVRMLPAFELLGLGV